MALIVHKHRFVLLHIEKTAGCAMREWLSESVDEYLEQHLTIAQVQDLGYWCPGYEWIGFVRNPYDRLVSWYEMERRDGRQQTFIEFLDRMRGTIKPQYRYFNAQMPVRVSIGRYESLSMDFDRLVGQKINGGLFNGPFLPVVNRSERGDYRDYYDDQCMDIARHIVEEDCKSFGYAFS